MYTNNEGTHEFYDPKSKKKFIFSKANYEKHCAKRVHLKLAESLVAIDRTLCDPDCVTEGPTTKTKKNFYKIVSSNKHHSGKHNVQYWKIPTYPRGRSKNTWIIATVLGPWWGFDFQIIHFLEKIIWRKPSSLI